MMGLIHPARDEEAERDAWIRMHASRLIAQAMGDGPLPAGRAEQIWAEAARHWDEKPESV